MIGEQSSVALWWRDDDAGRYSAELEALIDLAGSTRRPLGLAVVPEWLDAPTVSRVLATPELFVLQHGWSHADHASSEGKSIELGGAIDTGACRVELERGRLVLEAAFNDRFLPVLVPPWNRIDDRIMASLANLGFVAVSTFADDRRGLDHRLIHENTHIDLIDWQHGRQMKRLETLVAEATALLAQPRTRVIGILSHHLDMSVGDMSQLAQLLDYLDGLPACRWTSPAELFSSP